jgi:hypothetical protein
MIASRPFNRLVMRRPSLRGLDESITECRPRVHFLPPAPAWRGGLTFWSCSTGACPDKYDFRNPGAARFSLIDRSKLGSIGFGVVRPTPRRVRELLIIFGADRATIARWRAFWRDHTPQTPFWKVARARLIPVVDVALLPLSLLDALLRTKDPCQDWGHLLRFLSPLTIPGGPAVEIL